MIVAKKNGRASRKFFLKCLIKFELTLNNDDSRRHTHVYVEASLNSCKVTSFFSLVQRHADHRTLTCISNYKDKQNWFLKSIDCESFVNKSYVGVFLVYFFHFAARIEQKF